MSTRRVAIAGATGYAGEALIRILQQHPSVQLTHLAASAKWERPVALAEVFPHLAGSLELPVVALDPPRLAESADVVFLALPHGVSMDVVPTLLQAGRQVIDLGGDFRLHDPKAFASWYGKTHTHPELLGQAVYGISELFREQIQGASLIANPGCYATSAILACAPLLKRRCVDPEGIIVDAKSGRSGAGRQAVADMMSSVMPENLWAYKVNGHQHVPEIEQALGSLTRTRGLSVTFVPHVVPMHQGILSTIYLRTRGPLTWQQVHQRYEESYGHGRAPFVRLQPEGRWPQVRDVVGTNYCDLAFTVDQRKRLLIIVAVIDNLIKGAAGQAVQNLNLMAGWPETTGLL